MITFKKTFDFYATDGELDVFVNNIFDTIIGKNKNIYITVICSLKFI
jgi:hypothetical protein